MFTKAEQRTKVEEINLGPSLGRELEGDVIIVMNKDTSNVIVHKGKRCLKIKKESKASASIVQESSDEAEGDDVLTVTVSSSEDGWILDTRDSYHMTSNKNWFSFFRRWEDNVRIGDDKELVVQGSGSVQIQMYDGTVRVYSMPGMFLPYERI